MTSVTIVTKNIPTLTPAEITVEVKQLSAFIHIQAKTLLCIALHGAHIS